MGLAEKVATSSGTLLKVHKGKEHDSSVEIPSHLFHHLYPHHFSTPKPSLTKEQQYVENKIISLYRHLEKYAPHIEINSDLTQTMISKWFSKTQAKKDTKPNYRITFDIILGDGVPLVYVDLQKRLYADKWETEGSLEDHYIKISTNE